MTTKSPVYQQLIDGEWCGALSGATFERRSPYDDRVVGVYPQSAAEDAERAIAAARRVFDSGKWSGSSAKERSRILRKIAESIHAHVDELATSLSNEVGKPIGAAKGEATSAADVFEFFAAKALDLKGEAITQQVADAIGLVVHEPIGVVGVITPWNYRSS